MMQERKVISPVWAGLTIAGIVIAFALISTLFGSSSNANLGALQYLIILLAVAFYVRLWGRANHHSKTFGELFQYGFKATTVFTLIFIVFLSIFILAQPEIKKNALEATRVAMEKDKANDSDIEAMISKLDKYFVVITAGVTMFFLILTGTIAALIGAAITPKVATRPDFDDISKDQLDT